MALDQNLPSNLMRYLRRVSVTTGIPVTRLIARLLKIALEDERWEKLLIDSVKFLYIEEKGKRGKRRKGEHFYF